MSELLEEEQESHERILVGTVVLIQLRRESATNMPLIPGLAKARPRYQASREQVSVHYHMFLMCVLQGE